MSAIIASIDRPSFLRRVLLADAATCAAMGTLLLFAAGPLATLLELPRPLRLISGGILLPIAAYIAWVATRKQLSSLMAWLVVPGNTLWAAASAALVLSGWLSPNALGQGFVIVQAVVVALFAELEYVGLRRA